MGEPAESGLHDLAGTIDERLAERVLVFGTPPPHGRDLDLLARAPEREIVERTLADLGFTRRGVTWASFDGCTTLAVDVVDVETWGLDQAEAQALFAEADPLEAFSSLAVPAPHHQVLIAARRTARAGGTLGDRPRTRVAQALARDAASWSRAQERAPSWNAQAAMRLLDARYRGLDAGRLTVASARLELARRVARTPGGRRRLRSSRPSPRRPAFVAFSGLDGAGKSFQAKALQENLAVLGIESRIVWPPAQNALFQLPPALKAVFHRGLARTGRVADATTVLTAAEAAAGREPSGSPAVAASGVATESPPSFPDLPSQRPLVVHALASIVSLVQVLSFRAGARSVAGRPQVVIFDRYTLDAIVYVRHRWGQGDPLRWQCRLIRSLARRPLKAYLLEVAPAVAYTRKQDFPLETLRGRDEIYREQWRTLGVTRLDGERPAADLCAEIARDVWGALA